MRRTRGLVAAGTLALAALCLPPDATSATRLVTPAGEPLRGPYQRWVERSYVPTVPGRVRVLLDGCPGRPRLVGCVRSNRPSTLYLRRGAPRMRALLFHELGHLFDFRVLGRADRRAFRRIVRLRGRGWFRGDDSPAERFAIGYSLCARRRSVRRVVRGGHGFIAGPRRHAAICRLIRRAAGPAERPSPPQRPPAVTSRPPPPAAVSLPQAGSLLDLILR